MPAYVTTAPETRLVLRSRLEELEAVWPWVDALAAEYGIPAKSVFAIHLCLEEALSNVIRHGYDGQGDRQITVGFSADKESATVIIEDQASHFNPLAAPSAEAPSSVDELRPGGRGILLMRQFASHLSYEELPSGNRLTLVFPLTV